MKTPKIQSCTKANSLSEASRITHMEMQQMNNMSLREGLKMEKKKLSLSYVVLFGFFINKKVSYKRVNRVKPMLSELKCVNKLFGDTQLEQTLDFQARSLTFLNVVFIFRKQN